MMMIVCVCVCLRYAFTKYTNASFRAHSNVISKETKKKHHDENCTQQFGTQSSFTPHTYWIFWFDARLMIFFFVQYLFLQLCEGMKLKVAHSKHTHHKPNQHELFRTEWVDITIFFNCFESMHGTIHISTQTTIKSLACIVCIMCMHKLAGPILLERYTKKTHRCFLPRCSEFRDVERAIFSSFSTSFIHTNIRMSHRISELDRVIFPISSMSHVLLCYIWKLQICHVSHIKYTFGLIKWIVIEKFRCIVSIRIKFRNISPATHPCIECV